MDQEFRRSQDVVRGATFVRHITRSEGSQALQRRSEEKLPHVWSEPNLNKACLRLRSFYLKCSYETCTTIF